MSVTRKLRMKSGLIKSQIPQLAEINKQKIQCIETGVIYPSIREAAKIFHCAESNLGQASINPKKTCRGFHWQRLKETIHG